MLERRNPGFTVLEVLDRFENLSGKELYGYLERKVSNLYPREFAATLHRLQTLELVKNIDAGYAVIYSITNQGIVAL